MALLKIKKMGTDAESLEILAKAKYVNPIIGLVNAIVSDQTVAAPILNVTNQIVVATGTTAANAAQITGQLVFVTGSDAAKGVKLPKVGANSFIIVVNTAIAILKIYPSSGEKINGLTENAYISLAPYGVYLGGYKAAGDWYGSEITGIVVA